MTEQTLTPPQYANIPAGILYNTNIPDGAARFYAQIKGTAWQTKGKTSPALSMEELQAMTGKRHTAIYGYMTLLGILAGLQFQTAYKGTFIFTFNEPIDNSAKPEKRKSELSAKAESENGDPIVNDGSLHAKHSAKAELLLTSSSSFNLTNESNELRSRRELSAKPEKRKSGTPRNPLEASEDLDITIFREASGAFPAVGAYRTVIDTIRFLRDKKKFTSDDELISFLKPYALNWGARKNLQGVDYDPASVTWLVEWAVNERIPPAYKGKQAKAELDFDAILGVTNNG